MATAAAPLTAPSPVVVGGLEVHEVSKRYGFQLRSDDAENVRIFASLRALTAHIETSRTK